MKNFARLLMGFLLVVSCNNDSDDTIAICETPTSLVVNTISFEGATLTWQNENETSSFILEYGTAGFSLGSGLTIATEDTTISLSGLMSNTNYDVYIKAFCGVNNESILSQAVTFTTLTTPVNPQFLEFLSQLNLFTGELSNLIPTIYAFEYKPNSTLFSDYAYKQRIVALPIGSAMNYSGSDLLPDFPDNTVIAKTFSYLNDERDASLGRQIIETRILIKQNGAWQSGNYKWNAAQTDAVLDATTSTLDINYIDSEGNPRSVNYKIPDNNDCLTCHGNNNALTPIALKFRSLNYNNQLQDLIDNNYVDGLTDASLVSTIPDYNDLTETLENRARAYFDANCAYCHTVGGFCEVESTLRLTYEMPFADTQIFENRFVIDARMANFIPGFSMPFIGTSMVHSEGYELISDYLDTL